MLASVSVFLPPPLPGAVLIKTRNVRESTKEDWWKYVVAVCSQVGGRGGTLSQSDSAT